MKDQSQQPPKPGVTGSTTQPTASDPWGGMVGTGGRQLVPTTMDPGTGWGGNTVMAPNWNVETGQVDPPKPGAVPSNAGSYDPVLNPTGTGARAPAYTNPASRPNNTLSTGGNGTSIPTPTPGMQTDPASNPLSQTQNTFGTPFGMQPSQSSPSSGPVIGGATASMAGLSQFGGTGVTPGALPSWNQGMTASGGTSVPNPQQPAASTATRTTDIAQAPGQMGNQWGNVNSSLDLSKLPSMVSGDALRGMTTDASGNAYKQATGYLDPQWQNQETTLRNTLANQGVMQNSEAWNKAMDDFARQKEFAYGQARDASFNQGLAAQGQLFTQGLQGNQNAFSQQLANANLGNTAQNQVANQGLTAQQIAEQLQAAQTAASAQVGSASIGANASTQNVAAQLAAQREQNQFGNSLAARNQGINELLLQQRNPIDIANLLNQGTNVTNPQFTNTPNSTVNPTDIASLINQAYQGQTNAYNAQTGNANSSNAAMASIIAAIICDRRMKTDIRQIGMHVRGFPLYEFRYLWSAERMVGPMADEVAAVVPEAIIDVAGIQAVNMAMLEAA